MVQSKLLLKFGSIRHYFLDRFDSVGQMSYPGISDCATCNQTHSDRVCKVKNQNASVYIGDAMITKKKISLGIKTADCLPILLYDPIIKTVAAVHAGWRGLALGIIGNTVSEFTKMGGVCKNIYTAIGPSIKSCCYDVPESRVKEFKKDMSHIDRCVEYRDSKYFLSLSKIAQSQLENLGVKANNIDILPICTCCDDKFYSFRKEKEDCGRMLSVIGLN